MVMRLIIEPIVRAALLEDLGRAGDITSDAIVPRAAQVEATIVARQPGIVAGLEAALLAFELVEPALRIERVREDGAKSSAAMWSRASPARRAAFLPPSGRP